MRKQSHHDATGQPTLLARSFALAAATGRLALGYTKCGLRSAHAAAITCAPLIAVKNAKHVRHKNNVTYELGDIAYKNGDGMGLDIPGYFKTKFCDRVSNVKLHNGLFAEDIYPQALHDAARYFQENNRLAEYALGLTEFIYEIRTRDLPHAPKLRVESTRAYCALAPALMTGKSSVSQHYLHGVSTLYHDARAQRAEREAIIEKLPEVRAASIKVGQLGSFLETLGGLYDTHYGPDTQHKKDNEPLSLKA